MPKKILVFIPAYNCAPQIVRVLAQFDKSILKYVSQIIVVNNRSTDNTEDAVRSYLAEHSKLPLKLLRNCENYSLGGSHKMAFQYAIDNEFDYIVVLHGDDQGSIHDLLPHLKSGKYRKYDCFLGARFMKGSKLQGYSKFRMFGNFVFNTIFSIFTFKPVVDLGSGLNMYKVESLKKRFWTLYPDTLMFNIHLLLGQFYNKQSVKFFPLSWREDDQVSNVKMFSSSIVLLKLILNYRFNGKKYLHQDLRSKKFEFYESEDVTKMNTMNTGAAGFIVSQLAHKYYVKNLVTDKTYSR